MKKIIVLILLFMEFLSVFATFKSFSNKNIKKIEEKSVVKKEIFAMYTEGEDGSYTEYTDSKYFPSNGYRINLEMSNCVDNKGNIVKDVITGDSNKITVSSNKTTYCYLYFQKSTNLYELCKESSNIDECITNNSGKIKYISDIWDSALEEDGYRYVGTNPSNYICFGTTDKTTCTGDTDKYMYRIIGFFEDSSGVQHMKLIKKEALNTKYAWHGVHTTDTDWEDSDLYKGINGSYFLTDTTNYPYMADTTWTNKIETWDYTATNTKTYENYSTNSVYGPNYYYQIVRTTYLHEMNRSSKANCYYNANTTADCSVGVWDTISAKIGLMYVSDYQLSLGETALDYTNNNSTHYASMKIGWMHLSNNDSASLSTTAVAPPSTYEWTMSRYGAHSSGYYDAWIVDSNGIVDWYRGGNTASVRPVFYLTSDSVLSGGAGTSSNPYIISVS